MGTQVSLLKIIYSIYIMFNVYKEPVIIKEMLTPEICKNILKSTGKLQRSQIFGGDDSLKGRNSYSGFIEDETLIQYIYEKCKKVLKCNALTFENPQVVYYKSGGFYKNHFDYGDFCTRHFTFIFALNDNYEGGETYFPFLDRSFKLKQGDALFFHNYNTNGTKTKLALHQGKIVKSGEKWICNVWVRKYPYN